jgi:hypothetical protein
MNTPTKPRPFYVIAADMAGYDSETLTLRYHDCVITVAENREAALESSRSVLEDGFAPAAAFDANSLRQILSILEGIKLRAGDALNLHTGMDHEEMQAQRQA